MAAPEMKSYEGCVLVSRLVPAYNQVVSIDTVVQGEQHTADVARGSSDGTP